ncbi:MAG: hypothetical protein PHR16_00810 [Methylovulum sp.]|nr:hypothetical protein [Methylovulum sp.]
MINQQKKNRALILVIFGMSIIPFLIALALKDNSWVLKNSTNKGQLITPVVATERSDFTGFDTFSTKNMDELPGHWLLVNVIPKSSCNKACLEALLKTKQLRLMLNKELPRTRRVAIVFNDVSTDVASQWWLKDTLLWRLRKTDTKEDESLYSRLLGAENKIDDALAAKMIGQENPEFALHSDLIRVKPSAGLVKKLAGIRKGDVSEGMLFLMDPMGNLMMQYEPGFDPYNVKSDLMHLLRISQIG